MRFADYSGIKKPLSARRGRGKLFCQPNDFLNAQFSQSLPFSRWLNNAARRANGVGVGHWVIGYACKCNEA